jgi:cytochrome b
MTTTTTTTVVIIATMKAALAFGVIGTVVLILALIIRELATAYVGPTKPTIIQRMKVLIERQRVKTLGKNVLVAIVPMLMIFTLIVVVKVGDILAT